MELIFGNNYKAELVRNARDGKTSVRLYSPKDMFLCSIPCNEENFTAAAEALLNGYFAGWRDCRSAIKTSVTAALDVDFYE